MSSWVKLAGGLAVAASMLGGAAPASADGMPGSKGNYSSEPVRYNWGGVYVGASAGGAWGDVNWQYLNAAGGPLPNGQVTRNPNGGIYGVHVGIQHQWQSLVFGVEGSYSGSIGGQIADKGPDAPAFPGDGNHARLHDLATLGGRLGWTPWDKVLLYGTGGGARSGLSGHFETPAGGPQAGFAARDHSGWFAGGGIEYALSKNWIIGVDYKHVELDSNVHFLPTGAIVVGVTRNVDASFDVVTARLTFKLGREDVQPEPLK